MPETHGLDLPLTVVAMLMVLDRSIAWGKLLIAKRNGNGQGAATKLDLAQAKGEILTEVKTLTDTLHGRMSGIDVRVARIEGQLGGRDLRPSGG